MSRVLGPNEQSRVRPIEWRPARTDSGSSTRPARTPEAEPRAFSDEVRLLRGRVLELEAQIEQRARESYETGVGDGLAKEKGNASAAIQSEREAWAGKLVELAELRSRTLRHAEQDVLHLSVEIARRILNRELTVDPAALESLVNVALKKLEYQEIRRVRVYPQFEAVMRTALERLSGNIPVEVVPDPTLGPGGVVFEISRGNLDASIDTQLKEIERGLIDRLEES